MQTRYSPKCNRNCLHNIGDFLWHSMHTMYIFFEPQQRLRKLVFLLLRAFTSVEFNLWMQVPKMLHPSNSEKKILSTASRKDKDIERKWMERGGGDSGWLRPHFSLKRALLRSLCSRDSSQLWTRAIWTIINMIKTPEGPFIWSPWIINYANRGGMFKVINTRVKTLSLFNEISSRRKIC